MRGSAAPCATVGHRTGDWRSGSALRSHRRGHWFEPSIAHPVSAGQRNFSPSRPAGEEHTRNKRRPPQAVFAPARSLAPALSCTVLDGWRRTSNFAPNRLLRSLDWRAGPPRRSGRTGTLPVEYASNGIAVRGCSWQLARRMIAGMVPNNQALSAETSLRSVGWPRTASWSEDVRHTGVYVPRGMRARHPSVLLLPKHSKL